MIDLNLCELCGNQATTSISVRDKTVKVCGDCVTAYSEQINTAVDAAWDSQINAIKNINAEAIATAKVNAIAAKKQEYQDAISELDALEG